MNMRQIVKKPADTYPLLEVGQSNVVQLTRLSHQHLAIMDYMLENPVATMGEIAEHFGRTLAWVSTVRNSDLFKARLAERRHLMETDQHFRISQKLTEVAGHGVQSLVDIVQDEEQDAGTKIKATQVALESLGFLGGKRVAPTGQASPAANPAPININIGQDAFDRAREVAMGGSKPLTLEHKDEPSHESPMVRETSLSEGGS